MLSNGIAFVMRSCRVNQLINPKNESKLRSNVMSSSESYAKSGGFNDIDESDAILTQEEERLHAAARQPSGKNSQF